MWKRGLIALAGTAVLLGGPIAVTETQIALLPENEKFVVERDSVLGVAEYFGTDVAYAYVKGDFVEPLPNEIFRTNNTVIQRVDKDSFVTTVELGQSYYRETADDPWQYVAYATTTQEAYDIQKSSFLPFVEAADTGFQTTGTVEAAGSWTNFTTTRLNTSDNSRATCVTAGDNCYDIPSNTARGRVSDMSFSIPAGATINGIEVAIEGICINGSSTCAGGVGDLFFVELSWDNATNWTAVKQSTEVGTTEATYTLGGATDTWGRTWSDTEFAVGTFMARIGAKCNPTFCGDGGFYPTMGIDLLQFKVYYTAAGAAAPYDDTDFQVVEE